MEQIEIKGEYVGNRRLEKIGCVGGIMYNSEGNLIPWEFGKRGLTSYCESPLILKTIHGIKRHLKKFPETTASSHVYIRPYYRELTKE